MKTSRRFLPRPATLIAVLALLLSGTAGATAANLITGADVKNGSLRGVDLKDRSLTGADIKSGSVPAGDLTRAARRNLRSSGTPGPQGPPGLAGAPGPAGPAGTSRLFSAEANDLTIQSSQGEQRVVEFTLPTGAFALDAKLELSSDGSGDVCSLRAANGGLLDETEFEESEQIVLQGEFDNVGAPSRVRVSCGADDEIKISNAKLRALQVDEIRNQDQ